MPYFYPDFHSIIKPHRLLTSAGNKMYEVDKARIQLQFLSSQYKCAQLTRHWSPANPNGLCTSPQCYEFNVVESLDHILLSCPSYNTTRQNMVNLILKLPNPVSHKIAVTHLLSKNTFKIMQMLLDCTTIPEVIRSAQIHGEKVYEDLFYIGRTWCFAIHRERMKRLQLWNFR